MVLDPEIDVSASSPLKPILEEESLIPQKFGIPWESTCHLFFDFIILCILEINFGDGSIAILEKMR